MPRGVDFKIPLQAARDAHAAHMAGWSLRALARMHWQEVRDRIAATVEATTVHGNSRRAFADPDHPEHARHLAQRRHLRQGGSRS